MEHALVVWGPDRELCLALGRLVAQATGRPLVMRDAAGDGPRAGNTGSEGAGGVWVYGPEDLLSRHERLAALERHTVACVMPKRGSSSPLEELKAPAYNEAHWHRCLAHEELGPAAVELGALWQQNPVAVAAGQRSYCVHVGRDLPLSGLERLAAPASAVLLVTDSNVRPLHSEGVLEALAAMGKAVTTVELTPGEENKHLGAVEKICRSALANGIDRQSLVLGLGGGVVTDIAGFAASAWMRGVRWVGLPTTLLAMVDASVGGKTGVDLDQAKNAIGAFWQPAAVLCATHVLETEPDRGFRGALAEVVKTALIGDPELFLLLEGHAEALLARDSGLTSEVVRRCVAVKAHVVGVDEREGGLRAVLNLGHTIGHAIEAEGGYSKWTHGEAVSLGLVAALELGIRLGRTPRHLLERVVRLLIKLGLPHDLDPEALLRGVELLGYDKKRTGRDVSFVVAQEVGDVRIFRLGLDELRRHVRELAASLRTADPGPT